MKKIRIGNDIKIRWNIVVNGGKTALSDLQNTRLIITDPFGREKMIPFVIEDGAVVCCLKGTEQKQIGNYILTFWANYGNDGQAVIDCCDFIQITKRSCISKNENHINLNINEFVELSSSIEIGVQGKSAYEIWLNDGHKGTEHDFLNWLRLPSIEAADSAVYLSIIGETNDINLNK